MALSSTVETLARKPHSESNIQEKERQIAKQIPPALLLGLALGSMAVSAGIAIFGRHKETANFVGLWAPSFLLIGIYNKLSRLEETEESHSIHHAA
jgi:hypothetical protein